MPYTEYPIYYTNSKLGHTNRKLLAQTLPLSDFAGLSDKSYGYCNAEEKPLLQPNEDYIPLAPCFPFYSSATDISKWGLNGVTIERLSHYAKPNLNIKSSLTYKISDIALAGTRPVNTNKLTITITPRDFYPDVSNPTQFANIQIVIYVSREAIWGDSTTQPKLIVERHYFNAGSNSSTPDKKELVSLNPIPDVPYFFLNFAVSAPGAGGYTTAYSTTTDGRSVYYLCPGGGSGAGAQFTAILSTNTVLLSSEGSPEHTDKITIGYTLASQSYSSSEANFHPRQAQNLGGIGIDLVRIVADLHYTLQGANYYYERSCILPGGLIFPGITAYPTEATSFINNFINNKDNSNLVYSSFNLSAAATEASALIFHKANWMLPEEEKNLFNTRRDDYRLSQPFTVFNPEGLFQGRPETKIQPLMYTGAAGRPSILNDGPSPTAAENSDSYIYYYNAQSGDKGSGGSGSIWLKGSQPTFYSANGGPTTIILSW